MLGKRTGKEKKLEKMNEELKDNGFIIIRGVFSSEDIDLMRMESMRYFNSGGGFSNSTGKAKPDWVKEDSLQQLRKKTEEKDFSKIISELIDEPVEFISHNDLHLNRSVGWHKDRLNNDARIFEKNNPWSVINGESMKIYKVNLYLQDHLNDNDALTVSVGSHTKEKNTIDNIHTTHPLKGDIVIFDQRIFHRGFYSGGYDRLLICMGYGVKNVFFEEFKKGTEYRQNKQNGVGI